MFLSCQVHVGNTFKLLYKGEYFYPLKKLVEMLFE